MSETIYIKQEFVQDRFTDAFRKYVGLCKKISLIALSEDTGIEERTLKAYQAGDTCPSLTRFLQISAALGPAFVNECLNLIEFGGCKVLDGEARDGLNLAADLSSLLSKLTEALRDGKIDHAERAELSHAISTLTPHLEKTASHWRAGNSAPTLGRVA